jgi:hypothetical protein
VTRQTGFHGGRHPQAIVNPAEVVKREVERKRGLAAEGQVALLE